MPKRLRARHALMTFSAQPWNLFDDDPGAGGGGGGGGTPTVNEHGYPDATPVADMTAEHQAAYWRYHARKHEQRANSAPDTTELERLRAAEKELADRKQAEMTDAQRAQAEKDAAAAEAATAKASAEVATRRALLLEIALDKGLTVAQAERLRGSTKEELQADADELKKLFGGSGNDLSAGSSGGPPRSGGPRGGDVGSGGGVVSNGAERYRQRYGKN